MPRRLMLFALIVIGCFANLGCGVTMGPTVETKAVIVRPGKPVKILENAALKAQQIETDQVVRQDVGGWIAMPEEHWDAIKAVLEKPKAEAP